MHNLINLNILTQACHCLRPLVVASSCSSASDKREGCDGMVFCHFFLYYFALLSQVNSAIITPLLRACQSTPQQKVPLVFLKHVMFPCRGIFGRAIKHCCLQKKARHLIVFYAYIRPSFSGSQNVLELFIKFIA